MPITKRTKPGFILTNSTSVTVLRKGEGDYDDDGIWVTSTPVELIIEANVQPVQFRDIQMMPESERTKEWIKLYTTEELRTGNEGEDGWEADLVVWKNETYRVMRSRRYDMGVLDHVHVLAAKIPTSARGV